MAWRAILEADVLTQISGDELAAVRAASLKSGQADPLQPTIDQITQKVRGYVAACAANHLDADDSKIPDELIEAAVAMIVPKLMARVAGLAIDSDQVRRDALKSAEQLMRDVAACKFMVAQPTTTTTEEIVSGTPSISARERQFDRNTQDGI